ncbi:MAG: DMT family transporter [Clostridiales bacterium]|nr:DMT family transporter [Clostridiales bacterium]
MSRLENTVKKPVVVCILATICCALWGSAFPVIKIGYSALKIDSGDYFSQILFAGVRFTFAGLLTLLFGSMLSKKPLIPKKASISKICVLAIFQTILQYLFFYIGLARTTGTKSSILDSTSVFFSVIIACLIVRQERFTFSKLIGCLLGFAGVVVINLSGTGESTGISFLGEGFILLSALSYAVSSVLIKRFSANENPVTLSGFQFVLGGIVMIAVGTAFGGHFGTVSVKAVLIMAYLALLSAVAYTLWGILLKYNSVSKIAVFSFMTPVFGCLLSALLLGERLAQSGVQTVLSLLLVCIGIFIVNKKEKVN